MHWLRKGWRLPAAERWLLLLQAVFWLGCARVALCLVPFHRLAPFLGQERAESPATLSPHEAAQARLIGRLIRIASRHLPWQCTCLAQAMAGMQMLHRRQQGCTLYLGVGKDAVQQFCAHAWLRSGDVLVTGGRERYSFVVVGSFHR